MLKTNAKYAVREQGMTLIELMIAMLIGLVLVSGAITVFTQSRANFRTADSVSRLQENARYALDLLEPDVRLAGYWGLNNMPDLVTNPGGVQVGCDGAGAAEATEFAFRGNAVEISNENQDLAVVPCNLEEPRRASDVLIVRHASARTMPPEANQAQVRGNVGVMEIFSNGIDPLGFGDIAQTRDVVVSVYYVSESSNFDGGSETPLPSLRRLSLVRSAAGPVLQKQEIMPGVENLQVQLGVDTDDDRQIDRWVNETPPVGRIMAVRLWMLIRSEINEIGLDYLDTDTYTRPDGLVITPEASPDYSDTNPDFPGTFRRIAITKTISLRNAQS
jgi:type IV pilus assembly protein PilW